MLNKMIGDTKVYIVHYKHNGVTYEALFNDIASAKWFEGQQ